MKHSTRAALALTGSLVAVAGLAGPSFAVTKLTDSQAASQLSASGISRVSSGGCTNRNVSTCNNPTFIKGKPNQNYLAQIAPNPPACAKACNAPCQNDEDAVIANPTSDGKAPATTAVTKNSGGGTTIAPPSQRMTSG